MNYDDFNPMQMYCQNCGNRCIGYKSRDQTARLDCERCGVKMVSKRINKRIIDTRMTAPPDYFSG